MGRFSQSAVAYQAGPGPSGFQPSFPPLQPGPAVFEPIPGAFDPGFGYPRPISAASSLGPLLRDPATVASELLLEPSEIVPMGQVSPAAQWVSRGYANDVNSALSRLRRQVVQLKRDAGADLQGEQRQALSREADRVLDALDDFGERLVPGRSRASVADDYADVQARVLALSRDARASGLARSGTGDPARWLAMADERLSAMVSQGEGREVWEPVLVARAADNLVFLARDLMRQGEFGLSSGPGRRALQDDLNALTNAATFFRASVAAGSPRARLARDFVAVDEVWEHVVPGLERLNRDERQLLVPRAARVENVILDLHHRLGLTGTPARLEATAEPKLPVSTFNPVLPASAPR